MSEYVKILGYDNLYEINKNGDVRVLDRKIKPPNGGEGLIKGKVLKPHLIKNTGYYAVKLPKNKTKTIHRLLAQYFIPNPENKPSVNHINGIRTDNRIENLEWVSNRENCTHGRKNDNKKSIYPGVFYRRERKRWLAKLYINGVSVRLGSFINEKEAHDRYVLELNNRNITNKYANDTR